MSVEPGPTEPAAFWRRPLDADEILPGRGTVEVIEARCKGCDYCIEFCPVDVLESASRFNALGYHPPQVREGGACVDCGLCVLLCPEFAIYIVAPTVEGADAPHAGVSS